MSIVNGDTAVAPASRAERLALRVLQLGAVVIVIVVSTLRVFELDRFFVPKELALHLTAVAAGLLALGARSRAKMARVDLLLFGYLLLSALSATLATNPWLAVRSLAISASGVLIFWAARGMGEAGLARPILGALALAVVLAAATSLLQAYSVDTYLFSENRVPGGTLGNRNFVAHVDAFGFPVLLLAALWARRAAAFVISSLSVTIVTASIVLTRSRAAWLAFAAVVLVFFLAMLVSAPLRRDARAWSRLGGLILFAVVGAAAALLIPNTLRWRSENPYLETVRRVAEYQEGSGRGRLIQYERSLRMAARHPLLGLGPGMQLASMQIYATRGDRASLARAAVIDPGSYRVHLRLARMGRREQRCEHARKAHALFPSAEAAAEASRRCGE